MLTISMAKVSGEQSGSKQSKNIFPMLCGSLQECALSVTMERETEILTVAGQSLTLSGWLYRPPHCKRIK